MKTITLSLILFIAACGQIPLGTQMALNKLDPMTADVTAIRFAVDQAADVPLDTVATLHLGVITPEGEVEELFVLDRVSKPLVDTQRVRTTFAIAVKDRERFVTFREEILTLNAKYPDDSEGSLSISASGCLTDPSYAGPIIMSAYIGLDGKTQWLPLMQDVDIRKLGDRGGHAVARCDHTG